MRWIFTIALIISCSGTTNRHVVEGETKHDVRFYTDTCEVFDLKEEKQECVKALLEVLKNMEKCE